mgnify:FL=1
MIDFKEQISKAIEKVINVDYTELETFIEEPKDQENGDYAFPCFRLAKELRKSPQMIAQEISQNIEIDNKYVEKIEVVGGYLNFYINKDTLAEEVVKEIEEKDEYGRSKIGNGKTILLDYSSPNIAKPFHIGHLRTTLIGNSLYKIYKYLGYNTVGINHLGDYGTQFGKMIEAYKLWKNEYNLEEDPINKMMDMYVRINALCKEDEKVLENCRNNFKLLEEGEEYYTNLWKKFKDLSLIEFDKIYDLLNVKFDLIEGEAFFADKTENVVKELEEKGKVTESEGAKIVNLEDQGIETPAIVKKSDGSSIYASRDLAAIMYRAKKYDYDKCLYVVGYEQNLYFKQVFAVAKYLVDEKYYRGLIHVSYGLVQLPTGKMSTRLGNVVKIEDLINETIEKAKEIIVSKNPELNDKDEVAKKVGLAAIIFNTLSTVTNKDQIFDWNTALNFQGETGPYIQYTYVRTQSVLEKVGDIPKYNEFDTNALTDSYSQNILKLIYKFEDILKQVADKNEPSILSRYLIDLAKAYSSFYNENKIIVEDENVKKARVFITYATGKVLKLGSALLGIEMPNKM